VVRPSYVLGGRAMEIVYSDEELTSYFQEALRVAGEYKTDHQDEHPILIDKYLENAIEVDVDALSDGEQTYVAGIMEHIEAAGIHSGDSACVLPPHTIGAEMVAEIERQTIALAAELQVKGLMNIQYAIKDGVLYILEVNPRASRTAPFVSKATGVPLPRLATFVMLGKTLKELNPWAMRKGGYVSVKESVLPFGRFPGVDVLLGPEMRSTGEVMGIDQHFGLAFLKSQYAAGQALPAAGTVFISVNDRDKPAILGVAKDLRALGFTLMATTGTAALLAENGIEAERVLKVYEGRPHVVDHIKNGLIHMVINTASGRMTFHDSALLRQTTLLYSIPYSTTVAGAKATVEALRERKQRGLTVKSLQEHYAGATA